jgi:putative ABC transport system ATP-binding protein
MTPILQVKDVCKLYDMGKVRITALSDINLDINKGDFLSITGKSGSGKSTLMHIIGLLDTPTSGEVILNGKNTKGMSEVELAEVRNKEIGFIFQDFNLLPRSTVIDNVILPLKYAKKKIKQEDREALAVKLLNQVGLTERLTNRSNELSGGERQRVAIARALINNPSIILADEPTGNLDTKTGGEIEKMLIDLNKQGITVIIVTHDKELAEIAKRKIVLKDGKRVDEGK